MTNGEFLVPPNELTHEFVGQLKNAAPYMLPKMTWDSADGKYFYTASPIEEEVTEEEFADLRDMPMWRFMEVLNTWRLVRLSEPDGEGIHTLEVFTIGAGYPMGVARVKVHNDMLTDEDERSSLDILNAELDLQSEEREVKLREPSLMDYAIVENALFDLAPLSETAFGAAIEARSNMSEDELRWEKARKYHWLITPEMDKNAEPKWWGYSIFNLLYAVNVATPDFGAVLLEEHLGHPLDFFFVEPYPDETQLELKEKLGERTIVRLIPFSNIEWPEQPNNMTEAQQKAFKRLRPQSDQ